MNNDPLTSVRKRLGEIGDELRALPADDFSGKNRLSIEADALRRQLTDDSDTATEATLSRWADRSARKGAHTPDDDLERAKAAIVSPLESGGSA